MFVFKNARLLPYITPCVIWWVLRKAFFFIIIILSITQYILLFIYSSAIASQRIRCRTPNSTDYMYKKGTFSMSLQQVRVAPRHYYNHVEYTSIPFFICLFLFLIISYTILYPFISTSVSVFSIPFSYLTGWSGSGSFSETESFFTNMYEWKIMCMRFTFTNVYCYVNDVHWRFFSPFELIEVYNYLLCTWFDPYNFAFFMFFLCFLGYFIVLADALRGETFFFLRYLTVVHTVHEFEDYMDSTMDILLYGLYKRYAASGFVDYEEVFATIFFFFRYSFLTSVFFTGINVSSTTRSEEYLYWSICLYTHYSSCCVGMISYMEWSLLYVDFTGNATYFSDSEARSSLEDIFEKYFLGEGDVVDIFEESEYNMSSDFFKVEYYVSTCITLICAVIPYTIWLLELGFFSYGSGGAQAFFFESHTSEWLALEPEATEKHFRNVNFYPLLEGLASYMSRLDTVGFLEIAFRTLIEIDTNYSMFKWSNAYSDITESIIDNFWFSYIKLYLDIAPHSVLESYWYVSPIDELECSYNTESNTAYNVSHNKETTDHTFYVSLLADTFFLDTVYSTLKDTCIQNWCHTSTECASVLHDTTIDLQRNTPMAIELYTEYADIVYALQPSIDFIEYGLVDDFYLNWESRLEFPYVYAVIEELYSCECDHQLRIAAMQYELNEYVQSVALLEELDDPFDCYISESEYAAHFKPYYVGLIIPIDNLSEVTFIEPYSLYCDYNYSIDYTYEDFIFRNINYLGYMDLYPSAQSVLLTFNLSLIDYIAEKSVSYVWSIQAISAMYMVQAFYMFMDNGCSDDYFYFNSWLSQTDSRDQLLYVEYDDMMDIIRYGSVDWGRLITGYAKYKLLLIDENDMLDIIRYVDMVGLRTGYDPDSVDSVDMRYFSLSEPFRRVLCSELTSAFFSGGSSNYGLVTSEGDLNNFFFEWLQLSFMYNLFDFFYFLCTSFFFLCSIENWHISMLVFMFMFIYFCLYSFIYMLFMATSLGNKDSLLSNLLFLKNYTTEGSRMRPTVEFNLFFFFFYTYLVTWLIVTFSWIIFCGYAIPNTNGCIMHFFFFISVMCFNCFGLYYESLHTDPVVLVKATEELDHENSQGFEYSNTVLRSKIPCFFYIAQQIPFSDTYKVSYGTIDVCQVPLVERRDPLAGYGIFIQPAWEENTDVDKYNSSDSHSDYVYVYDFDNDSDWDSYEFLEIDWDIEINRHGIYPLFDVYAVACYECSTIASSYFSAFEQWDKDALEQYIDDSYGLEQYIDDSYELEQSVFGHKPTIVSSLQVKYFASYDYLFMIWNLGVLSSIPLLFHPYTITKISNDCLNVVDVVYSFFAQFPVSITLFFTISISTLIFIHVLDYWSTCLSLESSYTGSYSKKTESALITAFLIFLISESVLFCAFLVSFMWYSYHTNTFATFLRSTGLETELYSIVPICSTAALVSSGYCYNYSFYLFLSNSLERSLKYVTATVLLGYIFIAFQLFEYFLIPFSMADGALGSIYYLITGFHGLHVIIGVALIIFLFYIIKDYVLSDRRCTLYILSIAYWHFVDIIWFIVYYSFYSFGDPVEYILFAILWSIFLFFAISPPFEYVWSYFNQEDSVPNENTEKVLTQNY